MFSNFLAKNFFKAGLFAMLLNSPAAFSSFYIMFSDGTITGPVEDILGKSSSFDDVQNYQQRHHYNKNIAAFLRREDFFINNCTFDHEDSVRDFHMRCHHGDIQCFLDYIRQKKEIYDNRHEQIEDLIRQDEFQNKIAEKFVINSNDEDPNKIQFHGTLPVELYVDNQNEIYEAHTIADTLNGFPILVWNDDGIKMKPCHWTVLPGGNDIHDDHHTVYIQGLSGYNLLHYAARYNLISLLKQLFETYPEDIQRCLNERTPAPQDKGRDGDRVPLNFAVNENSVECASILLKKGADINQYYRDKPLIFLIQGAEGSNHCCVVLHGNETLRCIKQWFDQENSQRRMLQLVCDHTETDFSLTAKEDSKRVPKKEYLEGETILHQYIRSGRSDLFSILAFDYLRKNNLDEDHVNNRVDLSDGNIDTLLQFIQDVHEDYVPEGVPVISEMLQSVKSGVSGEQLFQQFQNRIRFLDEIYARFLISKHNSFGRSFRVWNLFKDLCNVGVSSDRALDVCAKIWAEEHENMTEWQIRTLVKLFYPYNIVAIGCGTVAAMVLGYLAYQRFWKTR